MRVEDFKCRFLLQKTTSDLKAIEFRFTNPITKKADQTTIKIVKVRQGELVKINGQYIINSTNVNDVNKFKKIVNSINDYIIGIEPHQFKKDDLIDAINKNDDLLKAQISVKHNILTVLEEELELLKPSLDKKKYNTIKTSIVDYVEFQEFKQKKYTLNDIDARYQLEWEKFLIDTKMFKKNTAKQKKCDINRLTINRLVKLEQLDKVGFIKQCDYIKKQVQLKPVKAYISFEEVIKIYETDFSYYKPKNKEEIEILRQVGNLNDIRDWIVIGWHLGQRKQTLNLLNDSNISGDEIVDVYQPKTDKFIPHIQMYGALEDYFEHNKSFPPMPGRPNNFNSCIRIICREMGMTEKMDGYLRKEVVICGKKTMRDVYDNYERWELVASHTLRRSFITHQHKMGRPADLVMSQTGHRNLQVYNSYNQLSEADKSKEFRKYYKEDKYVRKNGKIIKLNAS